MKNYLIPLFILFSTTIYSQAEEDYKNKLTLIKEAFNEKKASSLYQKFSSSLKARLEESNFKKMVDSLSTEKGTISSFNFLMDQEKGKNFLVEFENSTMLLFIDLSTNGEIKSFEIKEY